jgi:superoxide dismutase
MSHEALCTHWREVIGGFLKIGAMSYGGPAIMGLMQAEFQEKRDWPSRKGLSEKLIVSHMYEHSYHMDYGAMAAACVDAGMNGINNWANVARLYEECCI